jgi:uncharacterized YigZ family protein
VKAESYPVPAQRHRTELVLRRSRFVATVQRCSSVEEARAFLDDMRAEMPDATHHVYAFAVGFGSSVTCGMSDAGEPPGTAGRPALAVVRGSGLGDVCVVVSRYFGGVKLGTGGLARAYADAARAVLAEVPRVLAEERVHAALLLTYPQYDAVLRLLEAHGAVMLHACFGADVRATVDLPAREWEALAAAVAEVTAGQATLEPPAP